MNKIKFETIEEYFYFCKENEIYNIPRKYGSQYTYIDNGLDRKTYFDLGNENYISTEPKSYPCIFTWYDNGDNIFGSFIYPNDFND